MFGPAGFFQRNGYWTPETFNSYGDDLFSTDIATRRKAVAALLAEFEADPPATYLHVLQMFYGRRTNVNWQPTGTAFMDLRAGSLSFD